MLKIKKNDSVQVIKGKDRGKKGKVLNVIAASGKAIVEGINQVKKHKRKTQQDQQGGVVSIEKPISISNLMVVCKSCNRPVRIGFQIQKDGNRARFCKACKEILL